MTRALDVLSNLVTAFTNTRFGAALLGPRLVERFHVWDAVRRLRQA